MNTGGARRGKKGPAKKTTDKDKILFAQSMNCDGKKAQKNQQQRI